MRQLLPTILCLLLLACLPAAGFTPPVIFPPEEPQKGDPEIAKVNDEELKRIYLETVVGYRRANPGRREIAYSPPGFMPKTKAEQGFLIQRLSEVAGAPTPDWNMVRTIVWAMSVGMDPDPRIPELVRILLTLPRGEKMSDDRGKAYHEILVFIKRQRSPEAAQLLYDAAHRKFWGTEPFLSRVWSPKYSELSLETATAKAMTLLAEMPPELCLPWLELLEHDSRPDPQKPSEAQVYKLSNNSTHTIPPDSFYKGVRFRLNEIRKRVAASEPNNSDTQRQPMEDTP